MNLLDCTGTHTFLAAVEDGALRLANGTDSAGRLEVMHNGAWVSVAKA